MMKPVILLFLFLASQIMNGQSQWRPIGADDFNQASYGVIQNDQTNNLAGFRLSVRNGNVYSMNVERQSNYSGTPNWYVMGKYSNGDWQHIETPFFTNDAGQACVYSFAVDGNETPYFFFDNSTNHNSPTVKKFDGTSWINVGSGQIGTNASYNIKEMVIGSDNLPFVMYKEGIGVSVKKFNGTDWITFPVSDLQIQNLVGAKIKLDSNNIPYVLYTYYNTGGNYFCGLRKFNGSGWDEVGITDFPGKGTGFCLDSNNQPYVFADTILRKFDGTSWQTITAPSIPSYTFIGGIVETDADNNLYALMTKSIATYDKYLYKLVGGTWQLWGNFSSFQPISVFIEGNTIYEEHGTVSSGYPLVQKKVGSLWQKLGEESEMVDTYTFASSEANTRKYHDLSIRNGIPVTAFKNKQDKLSVREFVSGAWAVVGSPSISEQYISNAKIETDSNGVTYVAYLNFISATSTETASTMTVKKRVGNNWELVGPLNFSQPAEAKMDFKINHQNVPHVVYKSGRVQKFNGTSWEFVGGSAYSGEKDVQLVFDNNDQPYMIYDSGLTVKRFNGTSWEELGTANLTAFQNSKYPQIACDSGNNILIGFIDIAKKIHVLKWNGTIWEQLGNDIDASVTTASNGFLKLSIDQNDVPFVLFSRSNSFRNLVNLYKFNGTTWELMGEPNFSASEVSEGNILFTETNVPIVTYTSFPYGYGIFSKFYGESNALHTNDQQLITHKSLVISPNPVSSTFSISLKEEIHTIDIFDLTGKKVFSGGGSNEVDITSLQSGLYLIKVKTDTGNYTGKIVKN